MVSTEKTDGGHVAVDGSNLITSAAALLRCLAPLAGAIKAGLQECPGDAMPAIGLDKGTLRAFGDIFRAADNVRLALKEACDSCTPKGGADEHGLADMEVGGHS